MESTLSFATSMSPNPPPSNMIPHLTVSPAETTLEASTSAAPVSSSSRPTASPTPSTSPEPADSSSPATGEKKPLKKRKSWGQELPIPKTNLPPRKRAKTEDEKEQRRIERVLRNRAAAQTSRERKRLEVEKLESEKKKVETENGVLLQRLAAMEAENQRLSQQIAQLSAEVHTHHSASPQIFSPPASTVATPPCTTEYDSTVPATTTTTSTSTISTTGREQSPTLSPTLFKQENREKSAMNRLSFIPEYDAGAADDAKIAAAAAAGFTAETSDMTQHPAAMLCDLQCQSEPSTGESAQPATTTSSSSTASMTAETTLTTPPPQQSPSRPSTILSTIMLVHFRLCQAMVSTTCSSAILQPLAAILRCLKEGSPLPISPPAGTAAEEETPLRRLLPLILWLISTPSLPSTLLPITSRIPSSLPTPTTPTMTTTRSKSKTQTQTSSLKPSAPAPTTTPTATAQSSAPTTPTSPTTNLSQQRPVFRMRLLTRLLACSPALARPLRDATGRALQQVLKREAAAARGNDAAAGIRGVNGLEDVELCGDSVRCAEELLMGEVVYGWEFLMTVMWVIDCFEKRRKASVGLSTVAAAAVAKKRRVGRRGSSISTANLSTSRRNRSRKQSSHRQRPKGSGMK